MVCPCVACGSSGMEFGWHVTVACNYGMAFRCDIHWLVTLHYVVIE